jgi:immune inhibitor A
MNKHDFCFIVLTVLLSSTLCFATSSPKKGVKPPAYFLEFQQMIQSEYSNGYYAEKFRERKHLREQMSLGLIPQSELGVDTTNALTLLGQYTDLTGHYTQAQIQSQIFDGPNATGTVTDYFTEVSYNQLYFTGDCQGWYDMPRTLAEYEGGNSGLGTQGGPRFVVDLIQISDPTLNFVDYIQYYDGGGKPHIGFVAVIHAGADASAGAFNIWAHRWDFRAISGQGSYTTNDVDPVSGHNVIIDGPYAIMPELSGSNNNNGPITSIGVFAHEFGHIFGIPDLYDTDGTSSGLGNWCLMAAGSWGGNNSSPQTPVHPCAWVKKELGWVSPVNITSFQQALTVTNVEENPVIYRIWYNGSITPEYFLIENRQRIGFDTNIYNTGFLIFHIDETRNNNTNENRYLVDLEQADGNRNLNNGSGRGDAGDPFTGSTNNTRFDWDTNPNSKDYSLINTFAAVKNIQKDGNNMIGDFDVTIIPTVLLNDIKISENMPQNGRLEAGETGDVNFYLDNITPLSSNTVVRYFVDEPGITVGTNEMNVTIDAMTTQTVTFENTLTVSPDFQSRDIRLAYEVVSEGLTSIDTIVVVIGIPEILLISRAETKSLGEYYKSALLDLDSYYEESYHTDPEYISKREAIIVFSGRNGGDFTQAEIDSFTTYLDNGGNIFFSGPKLTEYLELSYPDFLHNVIGVSWIGNAGLVTRHAYGLAGDIFGDVFEDIRINGDDGADNDLFMDILASTGSFNFSLSYNEDGTNPAGGWSSNSSGGKVVVLGFGFESINNNESTITRTDILNNILQWFRTASDVNTTNDQIISEYTISQNYPNPFNPSTSIEFSLPFTSDVRLTVYNLLGQIVTELVNEEIIAGNYSVVWNGRDQDGIKVSSGVYLYKMQTTGTNGKEFHQIRKMVLLK